MVPAGDALDPGYPLGELVGGSLDPQVFPVVGQSLRPLFAGREADFGARYAFAQRREAHDPPAPGWHPGELFSLQTREVKYIHHTEGEGELYDLERDPLETNNRIATPHETKDRMRAYVLELRQAMAAQGAGLERGEINPEYVEELKALGYL